MTKMAIVFDPHNAVDSSDVLDEAKDWLYEAGFIKRDQLDEVYVLAGYKEPIPDEPQGIGAVVSVSHPDWAAGLYYVSTSKNCWGNGSRASFSWEEITRDAEEVQILSQGIDL
jgi:hypothetical protein